MPTGQYKRTDKHAGENHGMWKGASASYYAKHIWVSNHFGKANKCEECKCNIIPFGIKRYFEWSNISGRYIRKRQDWKMLCKKCHAKKDILLKPRGEKQGSSKLTEKEVLEILTLKNINPSIKNTEIAKRMEVNKSTINRIIRRITWKHVLVPFINLNN